MGQKKKRCQRRAIVWFFVSLFCLQCFHFPPADIGTVISTALSCQDISGEPTMRPDSRKYLQLYKTSTEKKKRLLVRLWCQCLRIKARRHSSFFPDLPFSAGVTRGGIHQGGSGGDNSLSADSCLRRPQRSAKARRVACESSAATLRVTGKNPACATSRIYFCDLKPPLRRGCGERRKVQGKVDK